MSLWCNPVTFVPVVQLPLIPPFWYCIVNPELVDNVILAVPLLHTGLLAIIAPFVSPSPASAIFPVVISFVACPLFPAISATSTFIVYDVFCSSPPLFTLVLAPLPICVYVLSASAVFFI